MLKIPRTTVSSLTSPNRLHDPKPKFFGPFITRVVGTDDNGVVCVVTSRRHRKQLQPLKLIELERLLHEPIPKKIWLRFWAPKKLSWWLAVSFILGSALFALGAAITIFPDLLTPWWHRPTINNLVYFAGSIFFTTGGYLQWLQSVNGDLATISDQPGAQKPRWRWIGWRPRNLGYIASFVQLIGTILFNFNTGDALFTGLSSTDKNIVIWSPNMVGSICFLISSILSYFESAHRLGYFNLKDITIWMAILNLFGSITFQISAASSYVEGDGTLWWSFGSYWGTFSGGLFFLMASYLLIPEIFEETGEVAKTPRMRKPTQSGAQDGIQGVTPSSA